MPLYDLKCLKCGNELKEHFCRTYGELVQCEGCGEVMQRMPVKFCPDVFPKEGVFLEHVSSEGKTFFSKEEMREFEKKHDLYIDCAHD